MRRLRYALAVSVVAVLHAACGGGAGPPPPDTFPPPAPTLSGTVPSSPSSAAGVHVVGTAEAGSTVRLYAAADCAGTPAGTAVAGGAFDIAATAAPNATTTFTATATDGSGNVSACSNALAYVHDDLAPAAPAFSGTAPASPSNDPSPHFLGTAEAGATVRLYAAADCSGAPLHTTTAAGGTFDVAATAVPNGTLTLWADATDAAGNASPCSGGLDYLHDGVAPGTPVLTGTSPASPSSSLSPHYLGTGEPGATVRLFATADCSGAPLHTGAAAAAGTFDVAVSAVANGTLTLWASAADAAGNVSGCSAALSFANDSLAPAAPAFTGTSPASPSSNPSPHYLGTAEAGATVRLYATGDCSGAPLHTAAAAGGTFDVAATAVANGTLTLWADAVDAVGNVSACSAGQSYRHDDQAPSAPVLAGTTPASPASDPRPHVLGTAEAGSTVRLFATADCSGAPLATGAAGAGGAFDLVAAATPNTATTFRATATDDAGNASGCSASLAYVHDDVAPSAPVLAGTTPASPSQSLTPVVDGSAEAGAAVRIHAGSGCSGSLLAQGLADGSGAFHVQVTVPANAATELSASASDAAGNASGCSSALTYVHDDVAPAAPVLSGSSPTSPADDNSPFILGTAEPDAAVALYADASCAGAVAGSGTAAGDGSFSIQVSVTDNTLTTFRARSTDGAGNASGCSQTFVGYVEESRTFAVTPSSVELDRFPSPLSTQAFSYLLAGGPDDGVAWSVEEAGGGTVDQDGTYQAPAETGTYHVRATTQGPLPALVARATVVVRNPVVQGSVAYAGAAAGRVFVAVFAGNGGGMPVGGTSVEVTGPGSYPFTVRGLVSTGWHRVAAWFDATGVEKYVWAADPYGDAQVNLTGSSVSGVAIGLVAPAAVAPLATRVSAVFPGDGMATVLFERSREQDGREVADAYDVECTTGAPPATPSAAAMRVPAGYDSVAFVRGLANGTSYRCSVWAENHGQLSAPAVSDPFVAGTPGGGFTVSGTITFSGLPPPSPVYVALLDMATRQARFARYDSPGASLAFSVPGVPGGTWTLGVLGDGGDDGLLGPTDLNTLGGGPSTGLPVTVTGNVSGQDLAVDWVNATAAVPVIRESNGNYAIAPLILSRAKLPATGVLAGGPRPDASPPADMGLTGDIGNGVALGAWKSLGATPPLAGMYVFEVVYADGTSENLAAPVTAASILDPPAPLAPVGEATPQPDLAWAEPVPAPAGPYAYRLSLRSAGGQWIWDTDDILPSAACSGGACQVAFDFDGRAQVAQLPPGDYQWEVRVQDSGMNQAWAQASFHVPVDVTVSPAAASLYPGEGAVLTASVTGTGSVTWSADCGTVTPRGDPLVADYVAPASGPCAVTATSTAEPTRSASAAVTVRQIGVAVSPATVSLEPGQVQYFLAAVTGPGPVTWTASCGTVAVAANPLAARYDAPLAAGPCTVTATSDVQPWHSGSAAVTIDASPQLHVEPATAVLNPGQTQPFVATLAGALQPVSWFATGGSITADGIYTANGAAGGPGAFAVVATDGGGRSATAVVQVVDAAQSPQPQVLITPSSATTVIQGSVSFGASVSGCVDQNVTWSVREGSGGSVNPPGPSTSATFQAYAEPAGVYHVVARASCDPSKSAVAAVTVNLVTVSGSVTYAGSGGGRVYVALVTQYDEVIAGTSLAAPGAFTLRGVPYSGNYLLRAWRDTLGVGTPHRNLEPYAEVPVTIPVGGDLTGVVAALADASPAAPPAPAAVNAAPTDGGAVVFVDRVQDASGESLADGYHLSCDTVPASGTPVTFQGTLADDQAFILRAANGTTWSCDGWATAGGVASPTTSSGPFTAAAPVGGTTVSGMVTVQGTAPAGPLHVVLYNEMGGIYVQRFEAPSFPQAFAISGVADGSYQIGAILDRADDGVLARTDPTSFRDGGGPVVTVAGGPLSADVVLPCDDGVARVATSRYSAQWGSVYSLDLSVMSGLKEPREVVLTGGPHLWPPMDLGIESNRGGGELVLSKRWHLHYVAPRVGDRYTFEVTWTDGTTATLQAAVTAVLDPPTPVFPVNPLATPITAPAVPVFQWAAPASPPAGPYTYSVSMSQPGVSWNLWNIPSTQLSAPYGTVNPGEPPATPAALPAGPYRWNVSVQDAQRNNASREADFTVTP